HRRRERWTIKRYLFELNRVRAGRCRFAAGLPGPNLGTGRSATVGFSWLDASGRRECRADRRRCPPGPLDPVRTGAVGQPADPAAGPAPHDLAVGPVLTAESLPRAARRTGG